MTFLSVSQNDYRTSCHIYVNWIENWLLSPLYPSLSLSPCLSTSWGSTSCPHSNLSSLVQELYSEFGPSELLILPTYKGIKKHLLGPGCPELIITLAQKVGQILLLQSHKFLHKWQTSQASPNSGCQLQYQFNVH